MKGLTLGVSLMVIAGLTGCSNMSSTEQRSLSGAGLGALGGAAIGSMSGHAAGGAAIGAAAGAAAGYLYDRDRKAHGE